ncbi:rfaE bifunctional protein nucleotidyltransferase chain/domain/rfaE bifunctional protein kinase chain/domain [Catenuloplanes nepalensis]|uniref:RfaE bifunctional protein nucleotidyltransferase chain/domain/rfaE bifunctional protein kinase chain/domain n=1 Tax=Catenuloplanes nepalensis TaxID=587533 RepID=A0ABT9MMT5_9ACTN|nr:rfaE bifunctional protein nucleotidyltransferase chain/domain/rfaE bifunctional protein kinase chain/domain [Catenuloplanes nepalensis]
MGDTLLDRDVDGTVRRIAPDAPVPVLDEESTTDRPGGAGLAALLAAGAGCDVALVTALAADPAAARLVELLTAAGVEVHALPSTVPTPEKIRLRASGQVLVRLDRGGEPAVPPDAPQAALDVIGRATAILVSDYGRGVARQPAVRKALEAAHAPIVWDPHPRGPEPVPNVRLCTPNAAEARGMSGDAGGGTALAAAERAGFTLRRRWRAGAVAVTVGSAGAVLCHGEPTPLVIPAPDVPGGDTCGAGDRFASTAALALARGALVSEAVRDAVHAASAFVAAGGATGAVTSAKAEAPEKTAGALADGVRARGGTVVATGGCFDLLHAGHLATLRAARKLGDCLIVCLNSDAGVSALKGPDRPLTAQQDRAALLAALDCVDAVVIFDEPTPEAVLTRLRPDVWVKGGDYSGDAELPESALVRRLGGRTVIVPYLSGRSTTSTIEAISRR